MLPYQSFKTLRLFGMALLYGYRGGRFQSRRFVVPSSVPPRRGRADCLRPLRRRPFHPSCRYPSPASRFSSSSLPIRYDKRGGGYGASYCLLGATPDGTCGLVMANMCSVFVPLLAPCVPLIGLLSIVPLSVSPTLSRSVSAWCHRLPVLIMLAILYRPAHRHERRGAERGECLLDDADRMMCVRLKKAGGVFVPRPLASALSAV